MAILRRLLAVHVHILAFAELSRLLVTYRDLTYEMTKRDITDRYTGQFLGTLWAFGHPLLLLCIYVFVFGYIFQIRVDPSYAVERNYIVYLMAGLVPWLAFSETLARSPTVVSNHANLVKQVVFPIEVLPVKTALASLVTQLVATAALLAYMLVAGNPIPATFALVPVLWVFQLLSMIGLCYILSALGTFFRDLKDILSFLMTANFFLMPMIYLPNAVPPAFDTVFRFNPFSYMIWCYQDAVFYGRFAHPEAWIAFGGGGLALYVFGYRLFRKLSPHFGDVV